MLQFLAGFCYRAYYVAAMDVLDRLPCTAQALMTSLRRWACLPYWERPLSLPAHHQPNCSSEMAWGDNLRRAPRAPAGRSRAPSGGCHRTSLDRNLVYKRRAHHISWSTSVVAVACGQGGMARGHCWVLRQCRAALWPDLRERVSFRVLQCM
jgi:hypothetical protein